MNDISFRDKAISILKKNDYIFFVTKYLRMRAIMYFTKNIDDATYIKKQYEMRMGKPLNIDHPVLYNEKVQYAKLFCHDNRLHKLVDKYTVREYVAQTIGSKYLTKIYGVYDNVDQILFSDLPDKFVMKLTNGSSYNIICTQKNNKTIKLIKSRFKKWLKLDFYMLGREWAYKNVQNRILCEEYLESDSTYGLNDYKVFCFDGIPKLIQVDYDRFKEHKRNIYTPEWEFIDEQVAYENDPNADLPKPVNLEEMLECAAKLSKPFPQVRVDFYSIGNRLVFGEMTFYHGAGYLKFKNEAFEKQMGDYWKIK